MDKSLPTHAQTVIIGGGSIGCNTAGVVTLSNGRRVSSVQRFCSSGDRCSLPQAHRFGTKLAKCLAGYEMTLNVEDVVNGSMG